MELLGSQYQYSNLLLCVLMALHSLPYYPNSVVFTPGLVRTYTNVSQDTWQSGDVYFLTGLS